MITNKDMNNKDIVSIFDPVAKAYRDVSREDAEKFIASAEEAKAKLASDAPAKGSTKKSA